MQWEYSVIKGCFDFVFLFVSCVFAFAGILLGTLRQFSVFVHVLSLCWIEDFLARLAWDAVRVDFWHLACGGNDIAESRNTYLQIKIYS